MSTKTDFAKFRKNSNHTLDAVAAIFGVDRTTILRWEKGKVPLPAARLKEFEEVTGIPRNKLRPDLFEGMELGR